MRRTASRAFQFCLAAGGCTVLASAILAARPQRSVDEKAGALRAAFESGVDSLSSSLKLLDSAMIARDQQRMQSAFRGARTVFKHQEALLVKFSPTTVSILNGPVEDEEDAPPRPLGSPAGFQQIEHALFGSESVGDGRWGELHNELQHMQETLARFRSHTSLIDVNESAVIEAARMELARVSTLSIAGVDSDESGDAIVEAAAALDGVRQLGRVASRVEGSHVPASDWRVLDVEMTAAIQYLRSNPGVTQMDRLAFLAGPALKVGNAIAAIRVITNDRVLHRSVWKSTAATVYDRDALDAYAYAPDFAIAPTAEVLALGERLFNDPLLSGPKTHSCASCHMPDLAFTDGVSLHDAMGTSKHGAERNTPTLLNAALHPTFFADGRAATLEDQVTIVLASPVEMQTSAVHAAERLNGDTGYRQAFTHVMPSATGGSIASTSVRAVLATYMRSLVKLDSRFDGAVRGSAKALTESERNGFTVFMGKGRCGTCHFAPAFSGAAPPLFTTSEPEIIGVPVRADTAHATIDMDPGREGVDGIPEHRHAFKVPSLRNVELTAPYMHNGAYATLEQVVDFYIVGEARVSVRSPGSRRSRRGLCTSLR